MRRLLSLLALCLGVSSLGAQDVRVRDLTITEGSGPVRLVGYGLVTGLSGTGDRVTGTFGARHTVQSVVNLLRNFEVQVPANLLRTRNVAAVLVTAEVSPYLRNGGRFDVHVSSVGDAQSLRGGVLWMTPLVGEVGGVSVAVAQGPLMISEPPGTRSVARAPTSGRVPDGGVIEGELPRPRPARTARLLLREPDVGTAHRIAAAIDTALGGTGIAVVEDPGAVLVTPPEGTEPVAALMARIGELRVRPTAVSRILIDARDGTVVAGADLVVGDGVVSADGITLVIGRAPEGAETAATPLPSGTTVREVAEALRAARASAGQSAAVFLALRDAGSIRADVVVR